MEAQLKRKEVDLYQWADEKDLERSHLTKEMINGEDEVHRRKEKGDKIGIILTGKKILLELMME